MSESEHSAFDTAIASFECRVFEEKEYLRICASNEVFQKKGKNVFFDEDVQIAIIREGNELYAVSNICPHQYAAVICDGLVEEGTITCPLHGWIYSLDSGKALGSNARLKTYHVFELEDSIWLEKPEKLTPLWLRNF
jgi:nitrite reductase/ring-hydroxylating ferredoxin subunit